MTVKKKVAGWGTLKNTVCHTNDDGPSPNSQCAFPFRQPKEEGEEGGEVSQSCSYESNPSDVDQTCKEVKRLKKCTDIFLCSTLLLSLLRSSGSSTRRSWSMLRARPCSTRTAP